MVGWTSSNNLTVGQANGVRFANQNAFIAFQCDY